MALIPSAGRMGRVLLYTCDQVGGTSWICCPEKVGGWSLSCLPSQGPGHERQVKFRKEALKQQETDGSPKVYYKDGKEVPGPDHEPLPNYPRYPPPSPGRCCCRREIHHFPQRQQHSSSDNRTAMFPVGQSSPAFEQLPGGRLRFVIMCSATATPQRPLRSPDPGVSG